MSKKQKNCRANTNLPIEEDFNELVLNIDKNKLDDEWLRQAKLYFYWANMLEDAREEFDVIKAEFDIVKSEVELEIRTNPSDYDLDKVTDKAIAATMIVQREYKEAQNAVFKVKHRVGVLQVCVVSLDQKKKGLEKLVDLHGQKYFASPRASENSREVMEEVEKQSVRRKVRR